MVDEMSWDDTENYRMGGTFRWPSMEEVFDYRERVKKVILDVIDNTPLNLPITQDSPWWSVFMGFDHERYAFIFLAFTNTFTYFKLTTLLEYILKHLQF